LPKAVEIPHFALIANVLQASSHWDATSPFKSYDAKSKTGDVVLACLPFCAFPFVLTKGFLASLPACPEDKRLSSKLSFLVSFANNLCFFRSYLRTRRRSSRIALHGSTPRHSSQIHVTSILRLNLEIQSFDPFRRSAYDRYARQTGRLAVRSQLRQADHVSSTLVLLSLNRADIYYREKRRAGAAPLTDEVSLSLPLLTFHD